LKIFQQTLIEKFSPNLDFKNFIAITIAIENVIRINQASMLNFQPDRIQKFFIKLWFKKFYRTLIKKSQPGSGPNAPGTCCT